MKQFLLLVALLAACRPAPESGSRNAVAGTARDSDSASSAPSNAPAVASAPGDAVAATDTSDDAARLARADAARIQGSKSAPVWIVEISDFQCPFCKRFHDETYPAIKREYVDSGVVRMAYVNFPLQMHANALPAAEAAMCAAAQNRFWRMHDSLFVAQQRWAPAAAPLSILDSLAVSAGVNAARWRDCMKSDVMLRLIDGDLARVQRAGVRSTPTFFVGDESIAGAAPIEAFRAAIARARAKATASGRPTG